MSTERPNPATIDIQETGREAESSLPMISEQERVSANDKTNLSNSNSHESTPSVVSEDEDDTRYADVNEPVEWNGEEDELRSESDVDGEQSQEAVSMDTQIAHASEHNLAAVAGVPDETIIRDFDRSAEAPAFVQRIVQAYLGKPRSEGADATIIDPACDAAVSAQEHVRTSHGLQTALPNTSSISTDIFRNLPPATTHAMPSQESPSIEAEDGDAEYLSAPEIDDDKTDENERQSKRNDENEDTTGQQKPSASAQHAKDRRRPAAITYQENEMMLPDVTNEGPASPIAMSDDEDNEYRGRTARSMASSRRSQPPRRDVQSTNHTQQQSPLLRRPLDEQLSTGEEQRVVQRRRVEESEQQRWQQQQQRWEQGMVKKRRLYTPWTDEELDALSQGVKRFGPRWALIKEEYEDVWRSRTNVDLKDKARNIIKQREKNGEDLEYWASCVRQ